MKKQPGRKFPEIATEYGSCAECGARTDTFLFRIRQGKCGACHEKKPGGTMLERPGDEARMLELESEGMTTSDAQGVLMAERMQSLDVKVRKS